MRKISISPFHKVFSFPYLHSFTYRLSRKSGFTLLEIMVALVILVSATSGLFASFVAAQKYVSRSRNKLKATNAARMVLDELRIYVDQKTWDDSVNNLLACPGSTYPCTKNYTLPPAEFPPGAPYNWSASYTIDQIMVNTVPIRKVSATVYWDEPAS